MKTERDINIPAAFRKPAFLIVVSSKLPVVTCSNCLTQVLKPFILSYLRSVGRFPSGWLFLPSYVVLVPPKTSALAPLLLDTASKAAQEFQPTVTKSYSNSKQSIVWAHFRFPLYIHSSSLAICTREDCCRPLLFIYCGWLNTTWRLRIPLRTLPF